jgi:hypothetical protein
MHGPGDCWKTKMTEKRTTPAHADQKESSEHTARFSEHPKIMLIDCDPDMAKQLLALGYNVSVGSFGRRYTVPNDGTLRPAVPAGAQYGGVTEQEVVVVDLTEPPTGDPPSVGFPGVGEEELWITCTSSEIDPRPRVMDSLRKYFDRILEHGGQFVVFAAARYSVRYIPGHVQQYRGIIQTDQPLVIDNWSFLSRTNDFRFEFDHGAELSTVGRNALCDLLRGRIPDAHFDCVISPPYVDEHSEWIWVEALKSKYGKIAAGMLINKAKKGALILLPDFRDKLGIVEGLLKNLLPRINPSLFPDVEGSGWIHRPEYELPKVIEYTAAIEQIRRSADEEVAKLDERIGTEREQNRDWFTLSDRRTPIEVRFRERGRAWPDYRLDVASGSQPGSRKFSMRMSCSG